MERWQRNRACASATHALLQHTCSEWDDDEAVDRAKESGSAGRRSTARQTSTVTETRGMTT